MSMPTWDWTKLASGVDRRAGKPRDLQLKIARKGSDGLPLSATRSQSDFRLEFSKG